MNQIEENMAEQPHPRPLKDYLKPTTDGYGSSIAPPPITKTTWEIKPALLNLISQNTFGGTPNEEPGEHLQTFQEICDTFKDGNIPTDAIYLRMFPFSLRDKAKDWVRRQPNGRFSTWKQLADGFLQQYYPPGLTNDYIRKISNFKQISGETLYEAWERYKDLQRQCPHHGFPKHTLINFFYAGVDFHTKQTMNHASGGSLMDYPPEEAEHIIEGLAINCHLWGGERSSHSQAAPTYASHSAPASDTATSIANQIAALTKKLNGLTMNQVNHVATPCSMCNEQNHDASNCPYLQNPSIPEAEVNYIGGRNPGGPWQKNNYNPTYSPNNRNHPNFSYLNSNPIPPGFEPRPQHQTYNSGYLARPPARQQQQDSDSHPTNSDIAKILQAMQQTLQTSDNKLASLTHMTKDNSERLDRCEQNYVSLSTEIQHIKTQVRMVETQVAQQAKDAPRPYGTLPSKPQSGPSEHCNHISIKELGKDGHGDAYETAGGEFSCKSVTLRSGKIAGNETVTQELKDDGQTQEEQAEKPKENLAEEENETPPPYAQKIPYPQRLVKFKEDKQFNKFVEVIRKLYITMPFTDMLTQVPSYAKFLKDVITNKRKIGDKETVVLSAECSAMIMHKLPKLQDPGSFKISCIINDVTLYNCLCDLGSSISLMPYSLSHKLGLGEPKKDKPISLRLADRTPRFPLGTIEDVLVKIGEYTIPNDFVVLDMEEDIDMPVILGRPFLATIGAYFDARSGAIELKFGSDKIIYNLGRACKVPSRGDECFHVNIDDY